MPARPDPTPVLREAGLPEPRPRVAVLSAVHDLRQADTDAIIGAARTRLRSVAHRAVYDVLRPLTDSRLLRQIQPAGSVARYETRRDDNHHQIDEAEIVYRGRCAACRVRTSAMSEHHRLRGAATTAEEAPT